MNSVRRIVVTWLATAYGGAEKSSVDLCRTIHQRYEIEAVLIVWNYGESFEFPPDEQDAMMVHHSSTLDEYRHLVAAALAAQPESTVLFSNHRSYAVDLQLAQQHGVPSAVIFRQTPIVDEALRTLPSPVAAELAYRHGDELDWHVLEQAAALVGVSEFGARGIRSFTSQHDRVVRIYNGLQMPGATTPIAARPVRRFLIVARLIDWKAIDFGIEAFAQLRQLYPDAHLQIAGDGEEDARLRKLVEKLQITDNVEFLGFVHDIRSVYLSNDCLLHLSGIESFGRVVIEAALCGLPAVVPQSAGTGELVINEHTGLTFDPNDLADCVRALERAYQLGSADYLRLATAARDRASSVFSLDRVGEEYLGLANSINSGRYAGR